MKTKHSLLFAALLAILPGSLIAQAAEEKAPAKPAAEAKPAETKDQKEPCCPGTKAGDVKKEDKATKPSEAKKTKKKGHDHAAVHKQMPESGAASEDKGEPKQPAHDHQQFHK